ncbi:MAG: NUMOD4 motif protein [bacterium ADurb.BinA186]|nr:MAG: NUMOD4 motif protein [bacterium ADurb.BinA186]
MLKNPFSKKSYPNVHAGHQEIWKDVEGYPGYSVSNLGRVFSPKREDSMGRPIRGSGHMLKYSIVRGYFYIGLSKDGKSKMHRVHRLVASAFIPNPNNYPTVNHIDGNKFNNCSENLEWASHKQNVLHAITTGLRKPIFGSSRAGLKEEDALTIREMYRKGESQSRIAKIFKISQSGVSSIIRKRSWKNA